MYNLPEITRQKNIPTALVAGGAGFFGAKICEELLNHNIRVVAIDNLVTGDKVNIEKIITHPRFVFVEHDLNTGLPDKIKSVDYVFHLAAHEAYLRFKDQKINLESLLTNAIATHNLLEFIRQCGARFIFASSVDIYQGIVSSTDLFHYYGPTEADEKIFSHSEGKRFAESLVWEYFKKYGLDIRVVRLSQLFGPGADTSAMGPLGDLIAKTKIGKDIAIEGDGLEKSYYIYLTDAVSGIFAAMFKDNTKGKIYPITDPTPITTLETAYIVKKLANRKINVVFEATRRAFRMPEVKIINIESQKEIGWSPAVDFKKGVELTLKPLGLIDDNIAETETPKKVISPTKISAAEINRRVSLPKIKGINPPTKYIASPKSKSSNRGLITLLAISVVMAIILKPYVTLGYYLWRVDTDIRNLKREATKMDVVKGALISKKIVSNLDNSRTIVKSVSILPYKEQLLPLLGAATATVKGVGVLLPVLQPIKKTLFDLGFTSLEIKNEEEFEEATKNEIGEKVREASDNFSYALAEIRNINSSKLPLLLKEKISELSRTITKLNQWDDALGALISDLPNLTGKSRMKTYLVLLQNSNELRPGGGFIGSYARIRLEGGRLKDIKIDDVYNPDGLLDEKKINMPAPEPVKKFLSQPNLRIRDSNWSASFPENAKVVSELYQKATSEKIDGVIAVDLTTVSGLLGVVGPITLTSFNEEINSGNLFERAQFHSEAGFFPGSTAKKTFLSQLGEQLIYSLFNLKLEKANELLAVLETSLNRKGIQIYLPESPVSSYLFSRGWDGSVKETNGDYLMLVEANVGSNKSNYYVRRQIKYSIEKINREGEMEVNLSIVYTHTGKDNNWPSGPYKSYLRVLVPERSALLSVEKTSGGVDKKGEKITDGTKIDRESGKTSFGVPFEVGAGESLNLSFSYVIPPEVFKIVSASSYRLILQKQAGAGIDPVTIEFTPPFGKILSVENTKTGWEQVGNTARWEGDLGEDLFLDLKFD